jgi:endonuclease YncB( thermonuclease family)
MLDSMRTLLAPIIVILGLAIPGDPSDFTGKVVGISDGDTLTVLAPGDRPVKVRLHGIDAPETGQPFGSRAKQAASELAFGQVVRIEVRDTDRYGRTVAEVIMPDGRSLNRELVREGMAWHYVKYAPGDRELGALQVRAREGKVGLWSESGPIAPWDWRSGVGATEPDGVVGNRASKVYHSPRCPNANRMKEANRSPFATAGEAEAGGYRKAGCCKPAG